MTKIIRIDPKTRVVEQLSEEINLRRLQALVRGSIQMHWIVPHSLPGHQCYVDEEGIRRRKIVWYFAGVHIWGPMVIFKPLGDSYQDVSVSLQQIRELVSFEVPGSS